MTDRLPNTPRDETLEFRADKVQEALTEYLSGYEFCGDDGGHIPTETERLLIDFGD